MIDNLYRNATTKIKWKGEFSEGLFINSALKNEIWKIPLQIFVFWML
jgi:hypothetical protein